MKTRLQPDRAEWKLGVTPWGQPLRLVWEYDSTGRGSYTLYRDQANQRDDSAIVRGLSPEVIQRMAEIVDSSAVGAALGN